MSARRLEDWADLARLDPQGLAALVDPPPAQDLLQSLTSLCARLPQGLILADAVHVLAERPPDREPLSPSSPWFSLDRELAVVVDTTRDGALEALLDDLIDYAGLSGRLAAAGAVDPELKEAAVQKDPSDGVVLRLLAVLGASADDWQRVDSTVPGLRFDVQAMLRRRFEAPIHLHPHVRPGWLRDAGTAWADELAAACPVDRPWVVTSDGPEVVELLSPYARDLTAALAQWAIENPTLVAHPGLVEALATNADDDLVAMVVADLFKAVPTLRDERRANERTQGLYLEDRFGAQAGHAEVERLAAPDPYAVPSGAQGTALIVAGGPRALRAQMVARWLKGPVAGFAGVFSTRVTASQPVLPQVVADEDDAFILPASQHLSADAMAAGVEVAAPKVLHLISRHRSLASRALGQIRKGQLCGGLAEDLPVLVSFSPELGSLRGRALAESRVGYDAARLVLRRAWMSGSDRGSSGPKTHRNPAKEGMPRRFRA